MKTLSHAETAARREALLAAESVVAAKEAAAKKKPRTVSAAAALATASTLEASFADRAAIASIVKAKNSEISPGMHNVDITVRVKGVVSKGEDHETSTPGSFDMSLFAAHVLSKLNRATVDSIVDDFVNAVENGEDLATALDHEKKSIDRAMKRVKESVRLATRTISSGKTTFNGTMEVVAQS